MSRVFRKAGADADRICTWVSLGVALIVCACVCVDPLFSRVTRPVIAGAVLAAGIYFLVSRMPRRLLDLLLPAVSGPAIFLPWPYSAAAAGALLVLFLILRRRAIFEAWLPVRAYFVRQSAQKR